MEKQHNNKSTALNQYICHRGFHPDPNGDADIFYDGKYIRGNWIWGYLWVGSRYTCIIPYNLGVNIEPEKNQMQAHIKEVLPETVSMFSGLYSNCYEKKIWQGDIVRFNNGVSSVLGRVVFEHGAFGIGCNDTDSLISLSIGIRNWCRNDNYVSFHELMENQDSADVDQVDHLEVLGNVWENDLDDFADDGRDAKFE